MFIWELPCHEILRRAELFKNEVTDPDTAASLEWVIAAVKLLAIMHSDRNPYERVREFNMLLGELSLTAQEKSTP